MESSLDFLASVLDEISLEGLDGITPSSLWIRLENRPHFPLTIDDNSKAFLWECVAVHKEIDIYQLPNPRPLLQIINRYEFVDPELGILLEPPCIKEDIYPVAYVEHGDVRGSCSTYWSRKCITSLIRLGTVLLMSLSQAMEKWGDALVLVSSPKIRLHSLIGTELSPLLEITKEQYCLLERIARSRFQGEISQGIGGLHAIKGFGDHISYHVKKLEAKGLVIKQRHQIKKKDGRIMQGLLIHLTRFYVQRKTRYDAILECLCNILKEKPGNREACSALQIEMGLPPSTFKKLLHRNSGRLLKVMEVPYDELSNTEQPVKNRQKGQVKVVQLLQPYGEDEFSDDDEKCEDISRAYFDPTKMLVDRPLIWQAYKVIEAAGPSGIGMSEIQKVLTIPKLEVRQLCRQLVKRKQVITIMRDKGRQRYENYILKKFMKVSESLKSIKEQTQRFIENEVREENVMTEESNSGHPDTSVSSNNDTSLQFSEDASSTLFGIVTENKENRADSCEIIDVKSKISLFQNIQCEVIELDSTKHLLDARRTSKFGPDCLSKFSHLTTRLKTGSLHIDSQISHRYLKRANIILEFINRVKLGTVFELSRAITTEEQKEGYNFKIDRRSTFRIIDMLCKDNRIKIIKVTLRSEEKTVESSFICDLSVKINDAEVKMAVENAKFRHFSVSKAKTCIKPNEVSKLPKMLQPLLESKRSKTLPKFIRMKTLHLLLFYLVHGYEGAGEGEESDEPFVLHDSDTWKRFVTRLPDYKREGWCMVSDVLCRIPLCILVKILNIRYEIPHLNEYLNDSEKQYYLLKHLPQDMRNSLLGDRRYIFSVYEVITKLCYLGLITFGPKTRFEKDQIYIYVHKRAQLKDTTTTTPSYLYIDTGVEYEIKEYCFEILSDVENYWIDMESICLSTPLGRYSVDFGKSIVFVEESQKMELISAAKSKEYKDVIDNGNIPGDGLGAAGLDSSLFSHLRRNWYFFTSKLPQVLQDRKHTNKRMSNSLQHLLKSGKAACPETRKRLQRLTKRVLGPSAQQNRLKRKQEHVNETPAAKKPRKRSKKRITRVIKPRIKKKRRPYYDEVDKTAMGNLSKLRTDWTPQEDSFLLLCKVSSVFLDPKFRTLVVPFTVIRDLLHEKFPDLSTDKTSRACQRRLRHMVVKNVETQSNIALFLCEAKQDAGLVQEFKRKAKPPKTDESEWRKMFTTVLNRLLEKFSSSSTSDSEIISLPDTLDQLHCLYDVNLAEDWMKECSFFYEPALTSDVCKAVLSSVVLSSLCTNDGQNWTYTLYRIYNQYPEEMLRSVIDHLHKSRLIVKKKSYQHREKLLSSIPYRFHINYENTFITKYPVSMLVEAKQLLKKFEADMPCKVPLEGDIPAGYVAATLSLILSERLSVFAEIPDQIIVFNPSLSDKDRSLILENIKPTLTAEESHELAKLLDPSCTSVDNSDDSKRKKRKVSPESDSENWNICSTEANLTDNSLDDFPSNLTCETKPSLTEIGASAVTWLTLHMLRQESSQAPLASAPHAHDFVAVNSCYLHCEVKAKESTCPKFPLNPAGVVETSNDGKSMGLKFQKPNSEVIKDLLSVDNLYISESLLRKGDFEDLLSDAYSDFHSPLVIREAQLILEEVASTKEIGIAHKDLYNKFKDFNSSIPFSNHIATLLKSRIVIRVGIASFRYVCIMHSKTWLVTHFSPTSSQKDIYVKVETEMDISNNEVSHGNSKDGLGSICVDTTNGDSQKDKEMVVMQYEEVRNDVPHETAEHAVCENTSSSHLQKNEEMECEDEQLKTTQREGTFFIPRTWKKPNGTFNGDILVKLLNTVLCFVMSCPGVPEVMVCKRFSQVLQPIETLELLEILEEACCIFKYHCQAAARGTAFSSLTKFSITPVSQIEDTAHYEPHPDGVVNMHILSDFIQSACFKEY